MIDAIIYDWNGTLIDDVSACHFILNTLLTRYKLNPVSFDTYRDIFSFPVVDYYKKAGFRLDEYTFEEVAGQFKPLYDEAYPKCTLYQGAVDALKWAKSQGIKQYLLSATQIDSLLDQTEYFGVTDYFDKIVGTDNFHGKSKLQEGLDLIKSENLSGKKYVLIGDTGYDHTLAETLGADSILVDFGHKPRAFLENYSRVFSTWGEIVEYLKNTKF